MANRWGNSGNSNQLYYCFYYLESKITADGDCSHEINRPLFLGTKVMTNLDSILKSKDTTLPTKVHLVDAIVFPVVTCERESWTIKKTEHRRIDTFELWGWKRLLRGWCTGMTKRDGTGREVEWGFRMGNACTPMVDSH